jgi:hypothetical protein
MKIAFVMASHGRVNLVKQNINNILSMGDLYLAITEKSEAEQYSKSESVTGNQLHIETVPNNPLGNKWQHSVDMARKSNPDYLVTCGSDDFLSTDYVENAIKIIEQGHDFVGVNGWYMSDGKKFWKTKYRHLRDFPAGSGRVLTKKALDLINWQMYDRKLDRLLDDKLRNQVQKHKIKTFISQDPDKEGLRILAVKGKWDVLNPLEKFLMAPTIEMTRINELPKQLPVVIL